MARTTTNRFDRPDFARIAASTDLPALVAADLGPPDRSGRWCCPFHEERTPSFGLTPDRRHFKCFGCGEGGDALDYVRLRGGLGLVEAARTLDPDAASSMPIRRKAAGKSATVASNPGSSARAAGPECWRDPAWQAAVDDLVCRAEATLWSPAGLVVRRWLQSRGLADHTIRRFRLGFLPVDSRTRPAPRPDGTVGGLGFRRGVTIPWAAPGASYDRDEDGTGPTWCGLNVRRLMPEVDAEWTGEGGKLRCLRGSRRGYLYPFPDAIRPGGDGSPLLLVEGEFDALLGCQLAGWLADVATLGSASVRSLPGETRLVLERAAKILVALDVDDPGAEGALALRESYPESCRRVLLPHGKDLGEFAGSGGDVPGWLREELDRLGRPAWKSSAPPA